MTSWTMTVMAGVIGSACACAAALAKLPPLSQEAKAAAAAAAEKSAWSNKVAAYELCQVQDKVAARYFASARAAGKDAKPAVPTAPCADPGAFVAKAAPSIESAGAHSPAATTNQPPNAKPADAPPNPVAKP